LQGARDQQGQAQQAQMNEVAADNDARRQIAVTAATQAIAPKGKPVK
jgi:hypothetical protein